MGFPDGCDDAVDPARVVGCHLGNGECRVVGKTWETRAVIPRLPNPYVDQFAGSSLVGAAGLAGQALDGAGS